MGLGRSQTITGSPTRLRRLQTVRHRVDERVDASADILEIDHEHVEPFEHLGRRLARFAVERVDRHLTARVALVRRLDHVVLQRGVEAVLRTEDRGQRDVAQVADAVDRVRNDSLTDAGLATRPTRVPRRRPEAIRRSVPSVTARRAPDARLLAGRRVSAIMMSRLSKYIGRPAGTSSGCRCHSADPPLRDVGQPAVLVRDAPVPGCP